MCISLDKGLDSGIGIELKIKLNCKDLLNCSNYVYYNGCIYKPLVFQCSYFHFVGCFVELAMFFERCYLDDFL